MKVKELIEHLQSFPDDLEVFVYADHGQTPQMAEEPSLVYIPDASKFMVEDYTVYEEEAEELGCKSLAVLI